MIRAENRDGKQRQVAAKQLKKALTPFQQKVLRINFSSILGVGKRMSFYEDMANFIAKGVRPFEALSKFHEVACKRRGMEWQRHLTTAMLQDHAKGMSFSKALARWIPTDEAALVMAGEGASELPATLTRLVGLLGQRSQMASAMLGALAPAAAIVIVMLLVMFYVSQTMQKQIIDLLGADVVSKLHFTPIYLGFCNFLTEWWAVLAVLFCGFTAAVTASMNGWLPGPVRRWCDRKLFPWNLYARSKASYFLLTAATSLDTGKTFKEILIDSQSVATGWDRAHYGKMIRKLNEGRDELSSMNTGFLPEDVEDRLSIYSQIGDFKAIMVSIAESSLKGLLKRVMLVGNISQTVSKLLLVGFLVATVLAVGEGALEFQNSINSKAQGL